METLAAERGFPIVGPQVGTLLSVLAQGIGARRVFEMGSGFGYSTLWFARAVGAGGQVVHTEGSEENSARAREFLGQAGLSERVRFLVGDARDLLRAEDGEFDIVFCDIDKEQYGEVPEIALPRLRPGGLLIVDNMLWYGRVLESSPKHETTRGVRALTETLLGDPRLETSILPIRDGVSVSVFRGDGAR